MGAHINKKALFLLFEGIEPTIFGSQVAIHAKEMKTHGYDFDIFVFETRISKWKESKNNLDYAKDISSVEIYLRRGIFVHLPFSLFLNKLLFLIGIIKLKKNIDIIHARTEYSAVASTLAAKLLKIPVVWDCRGDTTAELRYGFIPKDIFKRIYKKYYLRFSKNLVKKASKICCGGIFVSKRLMEKFSSEIRHNNISIIPCTSSEEYFFFDPGVRSKARKEYGIEDHEVLILYSGGLAKYQNFSKLIGDITFILKNNYEYKLFIVSPHKDIVKGYLSGIESNRYFIESCNIDEMNYFYNMCDYGTLIRDKNPVNKVASPTKFSEYCLTGLMVIMNDAVEQSIEIAKILNNYEKIDHAMTHTLNRISDIERSQISKNARKYFSRNVYNKEYKRVYDNAIKIQSRRF